MSNLNPMAPAEIAFKENLEKIKAFTISLTELKNQLDAKQYNGILLSVRIFDSKVIIYAGWKDGYVDLFEISLNIQDLEISKFVVYPNKQPIIGYNELKSILFSESIRHGLYNIQRAMLHLEL